MTSIKVRNPRSGACDYEFLATSADQLAQMSASLREGQLAWRAMAVKARVEVLQQFKSALLENKQKMIDALSVDTGRLAIAEQELFGLAGSIDRWCGLAPELLEFGSQQARAMPDVEIFHDASPYPLLGAISPWNFPLLLSFIDVTPALLAGCAAIIKPSEVTPRFAAPLQEVINTVPELAKVLAIAPGDGATGAALIENVDVVAFTGSVATGKKVAAAAATRFIPAFLELGGKDPAVLLPGSDIERAATSILRGSVSATGQACQSLERIYVHQSQAEEFTASLVAKSKAAELTREDPEQGCIGPLIFAKQAEIIQSHLDDATAKGAQIACGGQVIADNGAYWLAPTVLTNVDHSMKVMSEETFGPVMPVMTYSEVGGAVGLANDTVYGLSAAVFGPDEEQAVAVARQINAGGVSVNDSGMTSMLFETEKHAFGASGMGPSRVGPAGMKRFLRSKSLYVNRGVVTPLSAFEESANKD